MVNMEIWFPHVLDSAFGKTHQVGVLYAFSADGALQFSFFCLFHEANFNTDTAHLCIKCTRIKVMLISLLSILISFVYVILAISIHEFAHAYTADRLGDPTARSQGRLTLNPLAHIDLIGTIILPLGLMLLSGGNFAYGWGKPTPFDPYNLKHPRRDVGLISFAGPVSNLLLASIVALAIHFLPYSFSIFLIPFVYINVGLAIFNLIPVGPLDGQKILFGLLPRDLAYEYQSIMNRYGTLILLFLILPIFGSTAPISAIIYPLLNLITHLLLP